MKMIRVTSLILLFASQLASAAANFNCYDGRIRNFELEVSIDNAGKAHLSDGAKPARLEDYSCFYKDGGGLLFRGESGANTWGYEISGLEPNARNIWVIRFAGDNETGRSCEAFALSCFAEDESDKGNYHSPDCNILGDGCSGWSLPNGPS